MAFQRLQSLPAKVQDDLEQRGDVSALNKEIYSCREQLRRTGYIGQKRQLSKWREIQQDTATTDRAASTATLSNFFRPGSVGGHLRLILRAWHWWWGQPFDKWSSRVITVILWPSAADMSIFLPYSFLLVTGGERLVQFLIDEEVT